ncbi:hypothetical protein RV17_GL001215 [Enterococcus thailandicus]|nr:hypothetical protein RV17_GL001215 [Enterococcus thailandicus]
MLFFVASPVFVFLPFFRTLPCLKEQIIEKSLRKRIIRKMFMVFA